MKYLSLFSGIGGFELGIEHAYENNNGKELEAGDTAVRNGDDHSDKLERQPVPVCVGYSEIDKYATKIYERHFPEHKNYGDITKVAAESLPDLDLLVGGFPCQAFSVAGKRRGFEDTRGTLFFDIARILRAKRPRLFLLENVKGLLSHDGGRTFATIVSALAELGYCVQWQVLNSKNHGVPQNRERVFIVGNIGGTPRPQVFPFSHADEAADEGPEQENSEVASTLRSRYGNGSGSHVVEPARGSYSGSHMDGLSPTLRAATYRNAVVVPSIRRLTPIECERLQGFPDGWTEGVSDTQRYKCLGNAVTVNVIRDIMRRILTNKNTNVSNVPNHSEQSAAEVPEMQERREHKARVQELRPRVQGRGR